MPIELRGDCRELIKVIDHEAVLSGPRDTGKTVACCIKAHLLAMKYPKCQGAIVRKTQASLPGTVLQTWERTIKGYGVQAVNPLRPERYIYPNGSAIWCAGMDNPAKALSSERDFVYVNQAEELTEADWETLAGCCSGRGAVVAHCQIFADCNPAGSKHWIKERAKRGQLKLLSATHRDNPQLYTTKGELTEGGKKRLAVLEAYTGVRRKRLFEGIWATAEGAVYEEFDARIHVKERKWEEFKTFYLAIDEGYTNPAVILQVGQDADKRQHIFREFYQAGRLQADVVGMARSWFYGREVSNGPRCELAAVDESAAGLIADLNDFGVIARGGKGRVLDGINTIQNMLAVQGDGKPRLTVDPSCENVINEFESYVWAKDKPKDTPVKEHDHAMDALRYLQDVLGEPTGAFSSADGVWTGDNRDRDALSFGEDMGILSPTILRPEDF